MTTRPARLAALAAIAASDRASAARQRTEATRAVAQAFLPRLFIQNDAAGAYEAFARPDFIQHNPTMADGLAGLHAHLEASATQARGRPADRVRVFDMVLVDDDLFAVYSHEFRSPQDRGVVVVDIWRVADGRIVEHWDVIQAIPPTSLSGNDMACGKGVDYASAKGLGDTLSDPTCRAPDPLAAPDASKAVIAAYVKEVGDRDVEGAIRRWFSADYRQHSPTIPDGAEGAIAYLQREFGKEVKATPTAGPARVIAEGDYVLFHRLVTYPGRPRPSSNIDVFRVTGGKVSEHWDVKQEAPDTTASGHGMW